MSIEEHTAPGQQLFATATVARLCIQQGKLEQARSVLIGLLRQNPEDAWAKHSLREVEERIATEQKVLASSIDRVSLEAQGKELQCSWRISESGVRGAEAVLGSRGQLTLRRASFPIDPGLSISDVELRKLRGTTRLARPAGASLVTAAVGLLSAETRFVAIAHSDCLTLE